MADRIEWAVRATETGSDLATGTVTPTAGTGARTASATITIPSTVAAGGAYGIRWRGVDNAENAEAWKWRPFVLQAPADTTPPVTTLTTLSAGSTTQRSTTVGGGFTDA